MIIKIGTRDSALAKIQANEVKNKIDIFYFGQNVKTEILPIKTSGDMRLDVPLYEIGGKALFLKELEEALIEKKIDIAVHSVKDVPAFIPQDFTIPCILERISPADVFLSCKYDSIESLPNHAIIGTSSIRRAVQIKKLRPDIQIQPIRGNITTRIEKMNNFDGIILAEAGLIRTNLTSFIKQRLSQDLMLSAVGQGCIGVECLIQNKEIIELLRNFDHYKSRICINAERAFMQTINGSCTTPMAALAKYIDDKNLKLSCMLADQMGERIYCTTKFFEEHNAAIAGQEAGQELLSLF